jgi:stage II sporulation protein AA (anti-sigma F factor antagonist)
MSNRHFHISQDGSVHVLTLTLPPVMDPAEFDKLNDLIGHAVDEAGPRERFVIDLALVSYVGSALLGLLVNMRQRVKNSDGRLVLCGLNDQVAKALRTCSLYNLFTIKSARAEAVTAARDMR